jgi:lipopolysaccharide transport system ATP-binding protein
MQATRGEVTVRGRISALLELGAGFNPEFTGRENVILNGAIMGIPRSEMLRRLPEIERFAEIGEFFDQPVKTYSSGMFVRVAFAAAIHVDPEILIVDEALSVGDSRFQHRCYQKIREFMEHGKTILVVSHNTDTLLRICDRGIVIDAGELKHIGPISDAVDCYHVLLYGEPAKQASSTEAAGFAAVPEDIRSNDAVKMGSLSNDLRDRIIEKDSYNPPETRLGNGMVKIIDFDLIVDGEVNPAVIRPHCQATILVKVLFEESLSDVMFGFAVLSIDGTYICGTNSELMGGPNLAAAAGQCLAIKLKWQSHFVGGEHFLSLGFYQNTDGEKIFLDVRRSVSRQKFASTPGSYGFVDLEMCPDTIDLVGGRL